LHTLLTLLLILAAQACGGPVPTGLEEVPVDVSGVAVDPQLSPVLILKEKSGQRRLPIWIGTAEARSIASTVERHDSPRHDSQRPNAHDLMKRVVGGLEGEVIRVVVTELKGGTYYASLFLRTHGNVVEIDSRPSDAIALALRTNAPIFVRALLFESAAQVDDQEPDDEEPAQQI